LTVPLSFNTSTLFNSALSFRLGWEGEFRTLEAQPQPHWKSPDHGQPNRRSGRKLSHDPVLVHQFEWRMTRAGRPSVLNAIATFEQSLVTPAAASIAGSLVTRGTLGAAARWLSTIQVIGCVSCHQGVNLGGNLYPTPWDISSAGPSGAEIVRVRACETSRRLRPTFTTERPVAR